MEQILVKEEAKNKDGWVFEVRVGGEADTIYRVSLSKEYWQALTDGTVKPGELLEKSFEFLLAHESKEAVLREFELPVIQKYFPEFEEEIRKSYEQTPR